MLTIHIDRIIHQVCAGCILVPLGIFSKKALFLRRCPMNITVLFCSGPIFLEISGCRSMVKVSRFCVESRLFFKHPRTISGWGLREIWIPRKFSRRLLKAMKRARIPLNESRVDCSVLMDGNGISLVITPNAMMAGSCLIPLSNDCLRVKKEEVREGCPEQGFGKKPLFRIFPCARIVEARSR